MTSIILNSITGLNYPYDIYVCDVYGNNCGYISQINTPVPASVEIVLPPPFNVAPAVGIKIITSDGCERFRIIDCIYLTPTPTPIYYLEQADGFYILQADGSKIIIT
jgi:hypothetical protein